MSSPALATDAARPDLSMSLWARVARVLTSLPDWAVIVWIAATAAALNADLAFGVHAPMVFGDERIYAGLAQKIVDHRVAGLLTVTRSGYGALYPLMLAPAFGAVGTVPAAYAAAKILGSIALASSAAPAFLLARRVLTRRWAVVVAVTTVVGPQTVFASLLMTENVSIPVFLWTMLAAVRMLEHPTRGRQLTVLALVVVSILARMQAIAFLPGLAIAVAVFAGADGRGGFRARLRPFAATAVALGAIVVAGAAYVAVEHASAVGAYSVVLSNGFSPLGTLRWAAGNLADVDMLLGFALFAVAPFAVAAAIRPETATPASRAIAAVLVGFGGTSLLMVAAFSTSTQGGNREHVRYLIYFVPLLVMLSLRWLVAPGAVSRSRLGAAAVVAAALPIALPLERMRTASWVDSFGAAPWLNNVLPTQHLRVVCVAVAVCVAAGVVVAARRRLAFVLATFLVAGFVGFTTAGGHAHLMGRYAVSSPGWIDRSVGRHAHVDAIYVARPCLTVFQRQDRLIRLWRSAFFNRSVRLTYFVGAPVPDVVTSKRLAVAGGPARDGGRLLRPQYVLVQRPVSVAGTLIDTAGGFALVRPSWPLRLTLPPRSYLDGCRRRR